MPHTRDELTPFHYHTAFMKQIPHLPRTLPQQLDDVTPHEFRFDADMSGQLHPAHRIWRGDFLIGYTSTHRVERNAYGNTRYEQEPCLYVLKGFTPNTHPIHLSHSDQAHDILGKVCAYYNASVQYYNEHYGPYVEWANERHLETSFQSIAARRALAHGYFELEQALRTHLKRLVIGAGLELLHRPFDAVDVTRLSVDKQSVRYDTTHVARIDRIGQDTIVTFERDGFESHRYLDGGASDADILSFLVDDLSETQCTLRRHDADRYLETGTKPSDALAEQLVPLLALADAHIKRHGLSYFKD